MMAVGPPAAAPTTPETTRAAPAKGARRGARCASGRVEGAVVGLCLCLCLCLGLCLCLCLCLCLGVGLGGADRMGMGMGMGMGVGLDGSDRAWRDTRMPIQRMRMRLRRGARPTSAVVSTCMRGARPLPQLHRP